MFWSPEKKFKKLVTRYLDPTQQWSGTEDAKMRQQIRESETARSHYDQRIVAHRIMLGMDADTPSAVEKGRLMTATLDLSMASAPAQESLMAWWRSPALSGAMGLAIILVAVMAGGVFDHPLGPADSGVAPPAGDTGEYLGTRGGKNLNIRGGFGVTGQTRDGIRNGYEILHGDGAYLQDRLRFSYQCTDPSLKYLFLFGIQADARQSDGWTTHWYYPLGAKGELESVSVRCGSDAERTELEGGTRLSQRHLAGDISIIGIYSTEPLAFSDITARLGQFNPAPYLDDLEKKALTTEFVDDLNRSLRLDETAATSIMTFQINAGSKGKIDAR
jgi:hypothetical protein